MSFFSNTARRVFALAFFVAVSTGMARAQGVDTNSSGRLPGQSAFQEIKEDIFKPFESIRPQNSLENMINPAFKPPTPAAPHELTKRERELMEKRKNWMFADPNELYSDTKWNDALKAPDSLTLKDPLTGEKMGENSGKKPAPASSYNEMLSAAALGKDPSGAAMLNLLGTAQGGNGQFLKSLNLPSDFLGPDKGTTSTETTSASEDRTQKAEQQRRLDDFKRLLDPRPPVMPATGQGSLRGVNELLQPVQTQNNPVSFSTPSYGSPSGTGPILGTSFPGLGASPVKSASYDPAISPAFLRPPVTTLPEPAPPRPLDPALITPKRKF